MSSWEGLLEGLLSIFSNDDRVNMILKTMANGSTSALDRHSHVRAGHIIGKEMNPHHASRIRLVLFSDFNLGQSK